jgi:uncharacterized protein YcnI
MKPARLALVTTALLVAGIGPAAAHVTVNPSAEPGSGYGELTFRVPTESDTASTTKIRVFVPADHPLGSVLVKPHPGWTYAVKTAKLATPITDDDGNQVTEAVSEIDWTADSAASAIKPGSYDDFEVSVGPFPASGTMTFKALQTYSDGSVVRWIDASESDAHPAPVLTLTPTGSSADGSSPSTAMDGHVTVTQKPASKTPLVLSIIALVVAIAGAGAGLLRRRP